MVSLKGDFTEEIDTMVYIVMGVSGSGKTTVGQLLAQRLRLPFYDADDFHSAENVSKMESGTPLTDGDREGWLRTLAHCIVKWEAAGGAVLACSALKEKYRKTLCSQAPQSIQWIFLKGSKDVIKERLLDRKGHFMNAALLDSQFETLEEPEYGIKVSVNDGLNTILKSILEKVQSR